MTTMIRSLMIAASLGIALAAEVPSYAQANDPDAYGDGYQQGNYGRIRSADNGASIARADGQTDNGDRAGVNAPIFPGDRLRTDGSQRVEVQLANGTLVRLDRGGELAFQSLPDPSAKFQDNSVLALEAGTLRITSMLRDKEEFRIDTPDASVYLVGNGEFRIDISGGRGTRVASLRGVAEVVGNESSVLVRGGTGTSVIAGSIPADPQPYTAFASDGFDRWCMARNDAYRTHDRYLDEDIASESVPDEVEPYYGELSAYGRWGSDPTYGTIWYPSGVAVGWSPYSNGYWTYGPGGYFWVSYDPWGWAPYHYGNWQWSAGYGWGWVPGSVFAGAWVSWSWGSAYVGWAPLDYWGRPGWAGSSYYHGYYDPGCWTFVGYAHLGSTNVHRYAVPVGTVGDDLRHATVVSRPPTVDPRRLGSSNTLRDRALRDVRSDQAAHMKPVDRRATPTRTLADFQSQGNPRSTRATVDPRRFNAPDQRRATGPSAPGTGRDQVVRPRRILDDPRSVERKAPSAGGTRQEPRNDVRDLYQRMSRPRETQDVAPRGAQRERTGPQRQQIERQRTNVDPRQREQPQRSQPRGYVESQRTPSPRQQPQRVETQRSRPRDYVESQRTQPQRQQPQRVQPQRSQPQRPYVESQRTQPQRQQPQRVQPQRSQPQRVQPQRVQPQRSQPQPQRAQPQRSAPRQQPAKSESKQGEGGGRNRHR
jgi:hypothetical protein